MCGVMTHFGFLKRGQSFAIGSQVRTSAAKPERVPLSRASFTAYSSIKAPLAVFTSRAPFFTFLSDDELISFSFSFVSGQCREMMSLVILEP